MPRRPNRGFTLMELNTVVGIIGILAAIAIPNFIKYQHQARATEAIIALETIAYLQESYALDEGRYLACPMQPETIPQSGTARPFRYGGPWRELGFTLEGASHFQYEVVVDADDHFVASARGDLDGDGQQSLYQIDSTDLILKVENRAE